jgi:transcriptional regulator with XRE-family HTH domain
VSWGVAYLRLRNQLRRARETAGLTQRELAAKLVLSERHFARLESGETDPNARVLFAWAHAVGYRVDLTNLSGSGVAP